VAAVVVVVRGVTLVAGEPEYVAPEPAPLPSAFASLTIELVDAPGPAGAIVGLAEADTGAVDEGAAVVGVVDVAGAKVVVGAVVELLNGADVEVVAGTEVVVAGGIVVVGLEVVVGADVDVLALLGGTGAVVVATVLVVASARGTSHGAGLAVVEVGAVLLLAAVLSLTGLVETGAFTAVPPLRSLTDGAR
jgi:hypothetical protein